MENEYGIKLDRNGYAPSILQDNEDSCYLCGCTNESLDRHEVFFGASREKSKRLGLWVSICHSKCHIFGNMSVHKNGDINLLLKQEAQSKAMAYYGFSEKDFRREFYKSYL